MSIYIALLSRKSLIRWTRYSIWRKARFSGPVWKTHSPAVREGRPARNPRPWGRAQRMLGVQQWIADVVAPPSVAVWLTWNAACRQHRWPVCNSRLGTAEPCHADICAWWHRVCTLLDLPILRDIIVSFIPALHALFWCWRSAAKYANEPTLLCMIQPEFDVGWFRP